MGALNSYLRPPTPKTCLLLGLDSSGKTTLLTSLTPSPTLYGRQVLGDDLENKGDSVVTMPTSGVSLVEFKDPRGEPWRVWDLSGQGRFRSLWSYYTGHVQALIYCIDVTDVDRVACSRDEFSTILDMQKVKEKRLPVLVFATKGDLKDGGGGGGGEGGGGGDMGAGGSNPSGGKKDRCLTLDNIHLGFNIDSLQEKHKVKVFQCSGVNGTGVAEGFAWLGEVIKQQGVED